MLKGQDIVCVASSNWDAMWVNAQHLMHRLSVENRVLYLDNMGLRLPGASAADLGKVAARVRSWFRPPRRASATLWVVTPIVLPFHRNGFVRMLNRWLLTRRIKRVMRDMGMGRPILWSFLPTAADLVGCLGEAGVVYQCVDDYAANPGVPAETIRAQERRMEAFADVTIVTSPALRDAKKDRARYLLYSPNAADVPRFRDAKPALPDGLAAAAGGRRIIGYHGNVSAYKTDIPLLERVAREFPECVLLLVGPVGWGDPSTEVSHLLSQPNVLMPGRADDADLAGIVASFDVAILPMADNESTRASFPMKFYEYMAAGRPIVARDLPSFAEYRDGPALCRLAATHDDFVAAVRAALDDAGDAAARVAEAEKHDWTARVETISEAVEKAVIDKPKAARVAIVHDWLTGMRGGEKVLEVMCELWPDADLFTLLHVPDRLSPSIERMRIRTSFVQDLPNAPSWYRYYLPFFPSAIESFDFSEYDLVISSSHCVAKGARVRPGATHVSYVHTPMRYVWDMYDEYFGPQRVKYAAIRAAIGVVAERLRRWDVRTVDRVTHYTCNSAYVAERIKRIYGRDARVIHPPVDIERFEPAETIGDYYLVLSAMAPYKRVDLAIEAAARGGFKLKVAGIGEDEKRMRAHAPANVEFLGWVSDDEKAELYAHCRAFIFPGEEDFGITPLEAQAAGRPVIAYAKGGALETVIGAYPGEKCPRDATGVFFREQTVEALIDAVRYCEEHMDRFDPEDLRRHAFGFGRQRFAGELRAFVELARR